MKKTINILIIFIILLSYCWMSNVDKLLSVELVLHYRSLPLLRNIFLSSSFGVDSSVPNVTIIMVIRILIVALRKKFYTSRYLLFCTFNKFRYTCLPTEYLLFGSPITLLMFDDIPPSQMPVIFFIRLPI